VFGVSTLSVSAVLAAFMGGLALGALLFGRRADQTARPLRLYASLEAGIGLTALLVPVGFAGLTTVYTSLHGWRELGLWGGAAVGLNLLVALVAGFLGWTEKREDRAAPANLEAVEPVAGRSLWAGLALGCAAVTGAATLGLEVVWARILGIFTSNSAYAFAL